MHRRENLLKQLKRLQLLITMACILSGWLAGINIERYLVRVPAWRQVDILTWAEYSRHEYFGYGFYLFQFEAIGSLILLIASSIIIFRNQLKFLAWQVYSPTFFAIAALVLTFIATPIMFSILDMGNDPVLLKEAFENFHYWGFIRAVVQVGSFLGCAWAMGRVFVIKYMKAW